MELVLELPRLQQPRAEILRFVVFTPYQGLEARLKIEPEIPAERRSVSEVLASKPAAELVAELLRHETKPTRKIVDVKAGSVSQARLDGLVVGLAEGAALGLCSLADDDPMHVPMMDFRVPPGDEGLAAVREAIRRMGLKRGAILDSGRSYHFYGFDLMTQKQWWEFMAQCVLLGPLTDVRYIGHRLLEGMGILRLTSTPLKPKAPVVVETL